MHFALLHNIVIEMAAARITEARGVSERIKHQRTSALISGEIYDR